LLRGLALGILRSIMSDYESGSSPDFLVAARARLTALCEVNPELMADSVALAKALQGVSEAVSDIVLEAGGDGDLLRRSIDQETGIEHVVRAAPGTSSSEGAHISVTDNYPSPPHNEYASRSVRVPTDQQIDALLTGNPALWEAWHVSASAKTKESMTDTFFPFDSMAHQEGASVQYFIVLQACLGEALR
jgi:hypothetical protein